MTYDEVIAHFQDKNNLEDSFNGIFFNSKDNYFGCYTIGVPDLDDPEWISVYFEGGYLFDPDGEEDSFSLDDVPEEAKTLVYKEQNEYPVNVFGRISEYVLFELFPTLPDPEGMWSDLDKMNFVKSVKEHFLKNSDKVTLLDS